MIKLKDCLEIKDKEYISKNLSVYFEQDFLELTFEEAYKVIAEAYSKNKRLLKYSEKRAKGADKEKKELLKSNNSEHYKKDMLKILKEWKEAYKVHKAMGKILKSFKTSIETWERHYKINEKL